MKLPLRLVLFSIDVLSYCLVTIYLFFSYFVLVLRIAHHLIIRLVFY